MKKINKKQFYTGLLSIGRDVKHGIMCSKVCHDPDDECDCYEFNITDEDLERVNKEIHKYKTIAEALNKILFNKPIKK
jgi:hypothetical protein